MHGDNHILFVGSVSTSVDEAMALTQQQRELLRYRKTEQFQSSLTRPRAGSRVLCLDGGSVRGLIQIEVCTWFILHPCAKYRNIAVVCISSLGSVAALLVEELYMQLHYTCGTLATLLVVIATL